MAGEKANTGSEHGSLVEVTMMVEDRVLLVARPRRAEAALALSVIVPAFNESFRLPALLDALRHHIDPETTELVIVDDGSEDNTAEVARRAGEWADHLVVIEHGRNRGKGAAVRSGVAHARGDVIAFIDADNATDLSALATMVSALGPDVGAVFGSRHAPGSIVTGSPAIRGLMGKVFNHVVQIAAGTTIRDTQCGAKVFRAPQARLAFADLTIDGFAFDVEILRRLLAMGVGVIEHPVAWHYVHGTKIKLSTPLRMLRDIVRIRLSRPSHGPRHLDLEYRSELSGLVDPLRGVLPVDGTPCRVAVPFETGLQLSETLHQLGVAASSGQVDSLADWGC